MDESKRPIQIAEDEGDLAETVQQALRVAKKGRWWILLTGLGTLLLVVTGLSFVPSVYRSQATILVVEQQIPQNMVASLSNVTGTQKLQALTQEVLSRSSLLKIINDTHFFEEKNLPPDLAVELFRKSIGIVPTDANHDGSFNAFTISFSAPTPGMAQEVTRMLSTLFIERHSEAQVNRANSTTTFLKERLTEKRKRSAELEKQIQDFKIRHAGKLPDSRMSNETRMSDLRTQLQNTLSNLSRAKQQRIIWESTLSGSLNGRLTRLKTERTSLLAGFTPKHPEVIKRDQEITQLERILANLQAGMSVPEELLGRSAVGDPIASQLLGQIEANRLEVENLSQDQKRFEAMMADLQRNLNLTPAIEQQLAGLTRESEGLNQEIAKLDGMDQQSALAVDMERRQQGEQFRQLDIPILPLKPVSPARFKISAGAALGGFVLGFILAFWVDMRKGCFQTEQQIRRKFSPPLVLSIPELFTAKELSMRKQQAGLEWAAGLLVMATMVAVEFYIYRYS